MRVRYLGGGVVAVLLALVGIGVYVFVLGGGAGGSLDVTSLDVGLNDDLSGDLPDAEDGTTSCTSVGPPPDHFSVRVRGVVSDGYSGRYASETTYDLVVRIGDHSASRRVRVLDGSDREFREVLLVEDDESATAGEETTVTVSLVHDGRVHESVTRTVTVTERNLRCSDASARGLDGSGSRP